MAQAKTNIDRLAFSKGIITEASPLTFPENAAIDMSNFQLNRDGSVQRRLGMEAESGGVWTDTGKTPILFNTNNIATFRWDNVGNDITKSFIVVQVGSKLMFFDAYADIISAAFVGEYQFAGISGNTLKDFSAIDGNLIVVSKEFTTPKVVKYGGGSVFTVSDINIRVRDIWGVDDGLEVDEHPVVLSAAHEYNLYNQGWPQKTYRDTNGVLKLPHLHYFSQQTEYPANTEQWFVGQVVDGSLFKFDSEFITKLGLGNTPAAKGHFIIDPFDRGASRFNVSGVNTVLADRDSGKISAVASYAGRIFYSGVESVITQLDPENTTHAGTLFYTQVVENEKSLSKCYQEADPTAEDISELVATDGGTIKILEAGNILRLVPIGANLLVICDNGVWSIGGIDDVFKATEYVVTKVTDIGAISKGSVVVAEDTVAYWSIAGIYIISYTEKGQLAAQNMTQDTVQSLYEEIATTGKANATGNFDSVNRKITWLYNDSLGYDGISLRKSYNKELVFDISLQAFYKYDIKEDVANGSFVSGYIQTQNFTTIAVSELVVVNGEQVQVNGEDVVVTLTKRTNGITRVKYLMFRLNSGTGDYDISFGLYSNGQFRDWGVEDANAYLEAGHELYGDLQRRKQLTYLTALFKRTETGFELDGNGDLQLANTTSCLLRARWDFANSANSGKWGMAFQAYRFRRGYIPSGVSDPFDYGFEVVVTKNKVRGSGRALSLRMDTEPDKDLHLLGWSMSVEGGNVV